MLFSLNHSGPPELLQSGLFKKVPIIRRQEAQNFTPAKDNLKRFYNEHAKRILRQVGIASVAAFVAISHPTSSTATEQQIDFRRPAIYQNESLDFYEDRFYTNSQEFLSRESLASRRYAVYTEEIESRSAESARGVMTGQSASFTEVSGDNFGKLHPNSLAVLDAEEQHRLDIFKSLKSGWDFGKGRPLAIESVKSFNRFFAPGDFRPVGLCLLMASKGNLIASYTNRDGSEVEIEFDASGARIFHDVDEQAYLVRQQTFAEARASLKRAYEVQGVNEYA